MSHDNQGFEKSRNTKPRRDWADLKAARKEKEKR